MITTLKGQNNLDIDIEFMFFVYVSAMNQYQSGLDGTCHEHSVAPHKLSLRAMKAECKLHVPNLLSAKVCLARLTPSQLPSNALEQYYKLSVKSRVNGYWSGCNGINKRNVLSPKQHKDIGRKLINTVSGIF